MISALLESCVRLFRAQKGRALKLLTVCTGVCGFTLLFCSKARYNNTNAAHARVRALALLMPSQDDRDGH